MENDVSSDPLHVALLRPDTVVLEADAVPQLVEQLRRRRHVDF